MKQIYLALLLLAVNLHFGNAAKAKITSQNYYQYYSFPQAGQPGITTAWLVESEVIPVIIEEIRDAAYSPVFISVGNVLSVNDSTYLSLAVSSNESSFFGFVFQSGHYGLVEVRQRDDLYKKDSFTYDQMYFTMEGKVKAQRTIPLPRNIFYLNETVYWYQYYGTNGNSKSLPVSKSVAISILREDIREYLKKLKK